MRYVVLGVEQGKRCQGLLRAAPFFPAVSVQICDYRRALAEPAWLLDTLSQADLIKIDSPGEDAQVQHHFAQLAAGRVLPELRFGEWAPSALQYAGFSQFLIEIEQSINKASFRWLNGVSSILLMSDKWRCQQHLQQQGVPIPRLLGELSYVEQLPELLNAHGVSRVFIKARYGSSASGVIAYQRNRQGQQQAVSTLMLEDDGLFNAKKVRHYRCETEINRLLEAVIAQQAYVEAWIPKPATGLANKGHFDLRVLTLGGQAQHRIARASAQPMTNLHLDSERVALSELQHVCDERVLVACAEQGARAFADAACVGWDIVCRGAKAWVIEANAFGDLLPNLLWQGRDTYQAQLGYITEHYS